MMLNKMMQCACLKDIDAKATVSKSVVLKMVMVEGRCEIVAASVIWRMKYL